MKTPITRPPLLCIAVLLLGAAQVAGAQSIYKCTQAGRIEYTDHPCPGHHVEVIHQADDRDIIDQYLDLGQDAAAKRYADAHHLEALYQARLDARKQAMEAKARQQAEEAIAAKQRDDDAHQQALLDAAANRGRLQGENDALRQQNDEYREQQAATAYNDEPAYWGVAPSPYWNGRPHRPSPSKEPVFHPCKQLAGGRVQC